MAARAPWGPAVAIGRCGPFKHQRVAFLASSRPSGLPDGDPRARDVGGAVRGTAPEFDEIELAGPKACRLVRWIHAW